MSKSFPAAAVLLCLLASLAPGENWPQWRGPFFNGSTSETGLPAAWSATDGVAWAAPMPGPSSATPIVWGERVFVSSLDAKTGDLLALCLDAKDGKILWQRQTGKNRRFQSGNTAATPTACTDGRTVWFYFGTGSLFAFDFEGKPLWERDTEKDHGPLPFMFGYSTSPLLYKGTLYVVALRNKQPNAYGQYPQGPNQPIESYLLALDAATGKDLWRQDRPTDARGEAQEAYSSAIPFATGGREEILVYGADYLTAHDPASGKETWRWGGYNPRKINHWRIVPSAIPGEGLAYVVGPKYSTLFAIRPAASGAVGTDHVAWTFDRDIPDASMPALYQGRLYFLNDNQKIMTCLDAKTGEQKWQGKVGGGAVFRASVTAADGKLYVINEGAEVFVLDADAFKILHQIDMDQSRAARSSIAAANGRLYIRTDEKLYCIGK